MRDDEEAFAGLGRKACRSRSRCSPSPARSRDSRAASTPTTINSSAPEQFDIVASATILTMVVVGGVRTDLGPGLRRDPAAASAAGDPFPRAAVVDHRAAAGPHLHRPGADVPVRAAKRPARRQGALRRRGRPSGEAAVLMAERPGDQRAAQALRRHRRRGGRRAVDRTRADPRPHRPERRRQDLAVQPDRRRRARRRREIRLNGARIDRMAVHDRARDRPLPARGSTSACFRR